MLSLSLDRPRVHPFVSDGAILFPVFLLACMGIIMVYSASAAIGMEKYGNHLYFIQRQLVFCFMGLCAMFVTSMTPYRFLRPISYLILGVAIVLLCAVHLPHLGMKAGGAYRWIRVGGFSFQPSEFAKLALIVYLAYSLAKKQEMILDFFIGFLPHVIVFGVVSGLILLQPDLGSVVILGCITWGMMYIAGVRMVHLMIFTPFLIPLGYFFIYKVNYRMLRILAFLHPWDDPSDTGYQITHSLKAFGSGGLFGKGIALGMQKRHYLPEPHTDFIFSVIGEELGLVGVLFILLLYAILIWRGAAIARNCKDRFGALMAAGITMSLAVQVIINTGVTLGVLPTKGLTLPFLSYGGTSLLINMICMGILMNIGASTTHE